MKEKWIMRIKKLDAYLESLHNCLPIKQSELAKVPTKGIYMFLEENTPVYIGRTNRMKARLSEHGRETSDHNSASLAFRIAKEEAEKNGIELTFRRSALCALPEFQSYFNEAKKRVQLMAIKYVEINDPIDQALFEVYASEMFQTPYNYFDNH